MINIEHVKEWTRALRSGKYRQIGETLVDTTDKADPDSSLAYCCMGVVAALAGNKVHVDFEDNEDDEGHILRNWRAYMADGSELPGPITHAWLGLQLTQNLREGGEEDIHVKYDLPDQGGLPCTLTCAMMNDSLHLSFDQIADMIDYFGIKG